MSASWGEEGCGAGAEKSGVAGLSGGKIEINVPGGLTVKMSCVESRTG